MGLQEPSGPKFLNKSMNDFIQKANEAALLPNASTKPVELKSNNISFSADVKPFQAVEVMVNGWTIKALLLKIQFYLLLVLFVCFALF